MKEVYLVTVSKWGKPILTIEPELLSGADLSLEDMDAVHDLGLHLTAFSGPKSEPTDG